MQQSQASSQNLKSKIGSKSVFIKQPDQKALNQNQQPKYDNNQIKKDSKSNSKYQIDKAQKGLSQNQPVISDSEQLKDLQPGKRPDKSNPPQRKYNDQISSINQIPQSEKKQPLDHNQMKQFHYQESNIRSAQIISNAQLDENNDEVQHYGPQTVINQETKSMVGISQMNREYGQIGHNQNNGEYTNPPTAQSRLFTGSQAVRGRFQREYMQDFIQQQSQQKRLMKEMLDNQVNEKKRRNEQEQQQEIERDKKEQEKLQKEIVDTTTQRVQTSHFNNVFKTSVTNPLVNPNLSLQIGINSPKESQQAINLLSPTCETKNPQISIIDENQNNNHATAIKQSLAINFQGTDFDNIQNNLITGNSVTVPSDRSPLDIKSSLSQYRVEKISSTNSTGNPNQSSQKQVQNYYSNQEFQSPQNTNIQTQIHEERTESQHLHQHQTVQHQQPALVSASQQSGVFNFNGVSGGNFGKEQEIGSGNSNSNNMVQILKNENSKLKQQVHRNQELIDILISAWQQTNNSQNIRNEALKEIDLAQQSQNSRNKELGGYIGVGDQSFKDKDQEKEIEIENMLFNHLNNQRRESGGDPFSNQRKEKSLLLNQGTQMNSGGHKDNLYQVHVLKPSNPGPPQQMNHLNNINNKGSLQGKAQISELILDNNERLGNIDQNHILAGDSSGVGYIDFQTLGQIQNGHQQTALPINHMEFQNNSLVQAPVVFQQDILNAPSQNEFRNLQSGPSSIPIGEIMNFDHNSQNTKAVDQNFSRVQSHQLFNTNDIQNEGVTATGVEYPNSLAVAGYVQLNQRNFHQQGIRKAHNGDLSPNLDAPQLSQIQSLSALTLLHKNLLPAMDYSQTSKNQALLMGKKSKNNHISNSLAKNDDLFQREDATPPTGLAPTDDDSVISFKVKNMASRQNNPAPHSFPSNNHFLPSPEIIQPIVINDQFTTFNFDQRKPQSSSKSQLPRDFVSSKSLQNRFFA